MRGMTPELPGAADRSRWIPPARGRGPRALRPFQAAWCLTLLCCTLGHAQAVLQRGYDPFVTGADLQETILKTSNVRPNTFGMLFKLPVDDNVFAQPLYVPAVAVPNHGTRNVVYVATMSDSVYAFDADVGGAPLWSINLATSVGAVPVPMALFSFSGNRNIVGNLGILSTPVIDPTTNLMYLVAATDEGGTIVYRLHAINIQSGAEPLAPGMIISAQYNGYVFDARYDTQRVSLTLAGNNVVFGFAAVELEFSGGYSGWVMAYDKTTLLQTGRFATITNGTSHGGGVWQSGRPPVVDKAGYAYVFVGNGYSQGYDGVHNFSESALKLSPTSGLRLVDWFTPYDWSSMDDGDADLTSSGPLMIPGTDLIAGGGKTGDIYVLDTKSLGKIAPNDTQIVQRQRISLGELRGGPVYWQRTKAAGGPLLYNWGVNDALKAFALNGTPIGASPVAVGGNTSQIWPGGILTLSANGSRNGTGLIWANVAASGDAENNPPVPGVLHVFDAANVASELWNSAMNPTRDGFGNFAKFVPPMVANGKVYMATFSNQIAVYGLLR